MPSPRVVEMLLRPARQGREELHISGARGAPDELERVCARGPPQLQDPGLARCLLAYLRVFSCSNES